MLLEVQSREDNISLSLIFLEHGIQLLVQHIRLTVHLASSGIEKVTRKKVNSCLFLYRQKDLANKSDSSALRMVFSMFLFLSNFLKIELVKCCKVFFFGVGQDFWIIFMSANLPTLHMNATQMFVAECWYHHQEFMIWDHTGFLFLFWKHNALIKLMSLFENLWEFTCTGDADCCDSFWISWPSWWSS